MKMLVLTAALGLSAPLGAPAAHGAAQDPRSAMRVRFQQLLEWSALAPEIRARLSKAVRVDPHHARATVRHEGRIITLQARRVSDLLTPNNQRLVMRLMVGHALVRFAADNSPEVKEELKPFRFPDLILSRIGGSLVVAAKAHTRGLGQYTRFHHDKGHAGAVCVMPAESVTLKATRLIGMKKLRGLYRQQLLQLKGKALAGARYQVAEGYLAELEKHGHRTLQTALDLHACHLRLGDAKGMEASLYRLLTEHSVELDGDMCEVLHRHAAEAGRVELAELWRMQARGRNGRELTLEQFLAPFAPKTKPKTKPEQPKIKPKEETHDDK